MPRLLMRYLVSSLERSHPTHPKLNGGFSMMMAASAAETASFLRDLYDGAFIGETGVCCLCGGKYIKGGNNPFPLCADHETGRCCDRCDREKVQPARALFATGKLTRDEVALIIDFRDLPTEINKTANRTAFRELANRHRAELREQAAEVTRDA